MSDTDGSRRPPVGHSITRWAGLLTIAGGGVVLAGWLFDIRILKQPLAGSASMKANTALAFLLSGVSLRLQSETRHARVATGLGLVVALLGLVTLSQDVLGWSAGIDEVLFAEPGTIPPDSPGRMAPTTAFCFVLLGASLLASSIKRHLAVAQVLALVTALLAVLAVIGYLYDVRALYGIGPYTTMAVHTAILLALLSLGVLCSDPTTGVMAVVTAEGLGGVTARHLLPVAIVVPIVLGWLRLEGQRVGWYGTEFGLALIVVATITTLSIVIWLNARWLEHADRSRRQADRDLRRLTVSLERRVAEQTAHLSQSEEKFRRVLESAPDAIVIVDGTGSIVLINAQAETLFGYPRAELLGQSVDVLVPEPFRRGHHVHRSRFVAEPRARPMGAGSELYGRRRDGSEFPVEISLSPLETQQGVLISSAIRDISERKRAEEALHASLREKDTLLREIHHRVKNNLAVISSLFYLQSTYTDDRDTIRVLQEAQDRVRSMAMVHESLYQSGNLAAVDFPEYAQALLKYLVRTYEREASATTVRTDIDRVLMSIDLAIPCGLVLNELITNCVKHAFADGRHGTISVGLHSSADGSCTLSVADDGAGMPQDFDEHTSRSLGLRLVRSLARQLDGVVQIHRDGPGLRIDLTFPLNDAPASNVIKREPTA